MHPYFITHCFRSQKTGSATKLSQLRSFQLKKRIPSTFHSIKLNNPLLVNDQMQIANNTTRKQITEMATQNYETEVKGIEQWQFGDLKKRIKE